MEPVRSTVARHCPGRSDTARRGPTLPGAGTPGYAAGPPLGCGCAGMEPVRSTVSDTARML